MTMKKSIGHYLFIFTVSFFGFSILVGIIGTFVSGGVGGMSIVIPFIAAMVSGARFLKVENRRPSDLERRKLTNGSFLIFVGLNFLLIALAIVAGVFGELGDISAGVLITIMGVVLAALFLIAYFMIRWAYRGLLDKQADKLDLGNSTFD